MFLHVKRNGKVFFLTNPLKHKNENSIVKEKQILFISHDGNRAGAQLFLLEVVRYFQKHGYSCHVLFLGNGILVDEFAQYATTYIWQSGRVKTSFFRQLRKPTNQDALTKLRFDWVYVNTIAASPVVSWLKTWNNAPVVAHIHELHYSISMYSTVENRHQLFQHANRIIACAESVQENLLVSNNVPREKLVTVHSFINNEQVLKRIEETNRAEIRQEFGISDSSFCIVSCGNAEWRKGIDLFLQVAAQHANEKNNLPFLFIWVGMPQEGILWEQVLYDVKRLGLASICLFIPPIPKAIELISSMDIFLLPSREDPFPLVMLEAALAKKPIIGFENTGGCAEFVEKDAGITVPYANTQAMYQEIKNLYQSPDLARTLAQNAKNKVRTRYTYDASMRKIEQLMLEMTHS